MTINSYLRKAKTTTCIYNKSLVWHRHLCAEGGDAELALSPPTRGPSPELGHLPWLCRATRAPLFLLWHLRGALVIPQEFSSSVSQMLPHHSRVGLIPLPPYPRKIPGQVRFLLHQVFALIPLGADSRPHLRLSPGSHLPPGYRGVRSREKHLTHLPLQDRWAFQLCLLKKFQVDKLQVSNP